MPCPVEARSLQRSANSQKADVAAYEHNLTKTERFHTDGERKYLRENCDAQQLRHLSWEYFTAAEKFDKARATAFERYKAILNSHYSSATESEFNTRYANSAIAKLKTVGLAERAKAMAAVKPEEIFNDPNPRVESYNLLFVF